ncbi:hypothetical protein [Micromonospora sp. NPDC047187]|uniref:hypothetical protein n=1 Tax=Micromonospora sp. NPDC047187 TaxID=3155262 RepID=UPI0033D5025F
MAECILVYGCGRASRADAHREMAIHAMNNRLQSAGLPLIAPRNFAAVEVVDAVVLPRGKHRPPTALPALIARQVYRLVTDANARVRAIEAAAMSISTDTRIVIAHSWGSVAAYEALCLLPRHNVTHFLTLGSPLAIPVYVRGRLATFSACGRHAWPRTVEWWCNFVDGRDPVAWWRLRRHFGDGTRIEERSIRLASGNPHKLSAYLACPEVIGALGRALLAGPSVVAEAAA